MRIDPLCSAAGSVERGDTFGAPQDFLEGLPSSPDHCRDRQGPSIGVSGMCTEKGVPVRREETSYAGYEGACLLPPEVPRYVKRVGVALSDMVEWYGDALAVGLDQACPTRGSQSFRIPTLAERRTPRFTTTPYSRHGFLSVHTFVNSYQG